MMGLFRDFYDALLWRVELTMVKRRTLVMPIPILCTASTSKFSSRCRLMFPVDM